MNQLAHQNLPFKPKGRQIFVSCGCEACKRVAHAVVADSASIVLIGIKEEEDVRAVAAKVGWKGEVWNDDGARFAMKHHLADCPKAAKYSSGRLIEIPIEQLGKTWGSSKEGGPGHD